MLAAGQSPEKINMKTTKDPRRTKTYVTLLNEVRNLVREAGRTGSQALNEVRLDSYWKIGHHLGKLRHQNDVYIRFMAKDIGVSETLLYRSHRFFNCWPKGLPPTAKRLSWTHHLLLLGLKNHDEIEFYIQMTIERNLSQNFLRSAIVKDFYHAQKISANNKTTLLARLNDPLNIYKAVPETVIDGDTFSARIDLGFNTWSTQRLRLRGINSMELSKKNQPSLNESRAQRAKEFIEEKFKMVTFIVVKTYKTDIYGRFIADVFYHPNFDDKRDVATKGFFLNEELIHAKLAERVMV